MKCEECNQETGNSFQKICDNCITKEKQAEEQQAEEHYKQQEQQKTDQYYEIKFIVTDSKLDINSKLDRIKQIINDEKV